jgi:hypothetical protein
MCEVTRIDRIRNEYIRGSLKVVPETEKMRSNRLAWYGHVKRMDESHITKGVLSMNVDGHPSRGCPKKRWMDRVKDDMRIKGVSMVMMSDRREWKKKRRRQVIKENERRKHTCRPHLVG